MTKPPTRAASPAKPTAAAEAEKDRAANTNPNDSGPDTSLNDPEGNVKTDSRHTAGSSTTDGGTVQDEPKPEDLPADAKIPPLSHQIAPNSAPAPVDLDARSGQDLTDEAEKTEAKDDLNRPPWSGRATGGKAAASASPERDKAKADKDEDDDD